jgi:hypothetical protein
VGRCHHWRPGGDATRSRAESDVVEAGAAIERLAAATSDGWRVRDIWLLRSRALVARARSDQAAYKKLVRRYQMMAKSSGYEGHIEWSETTTCA